MFGAILENIENYYIVTSSLLIRIMIDDNKKLEKIEAELEYTSF